MHGCAEIGDVATQDSQKSLDSGGDARAPCGDEYEFSGGMLQWNSEGATLNFCYGSGAYFFGLADTSIGGWIGEDCIPANNATADGGTGVERCHQSTASGGSWRVCDDVEFNADEADDCTRLTAELAARGRLAYILGTEAGDCWVWGSAGYYESFGYSCDIVD